MNATFYILPCVAVTWCHMMNMLRGVRIQIPFVDEKLLWKFGLRNGNPFHCTISSLHNLSRGCLTQTICYCSMIEGSGVTADTSFL